MPQPFDQSSYQVRFEWGVAGLQRLAPADVVVVVDVLRFSSTVTDAVASGRTVALADAAGWSRAGRAVDPGGRDRRRDCGADPRGRRDADSARDQSGTRRGAGRGLSRAGRGGQPARVT